MTRADDDRIVLLRHAEPAAAGRVMGAGHDPGLTGRGRAQAAAAGARLAAAVVHGALPAPTRVVASDARRATATAAALAAVGLPSPTTDPRWRERDLGRWAGRPWAALLAALPQRATTDPAAWDDLAPPGGESLAACTTRVVAALGALHGRGTTVVVTHAGALRVVLGHVLDLPPGHAHRIDVPHGRAVVLRDAGGTPVVERVGA